MLLVSRMWKFNKQKLADNDGILFVIFGRRGCNAIWTSFVRHLRNLNCLDYLLGVLFWMQNFSKGRNCNYFHIPVYLHVLSFLEDSSNLLKKKKSERLYCLDNIKSFLTFIVVFHHILCMFVGGGWYVGNRIMQLFTSHLHTWISLRILVFSHFNHIVSILYL